MFDCSGDSYGPNWRLVITKGFDSVDQCMLMSLSHIAFTKKNRHACVVIIYATSGCYFKILLSCVNNNSKCIVLVDAALVVVQLECVVLANCI